jgi:TonB family protein
MRQFGMVALAAVLGPALQAASVNGRVYDPSGAVTPAARIVLVNSAAGLNQTAETGDTGEFSFTGLSAGNYRLEVAKPGFVLFARNVRLAENAEERVPVLLKIGQLNETLRVTAQGSAIPRPVRIRVGGNLQPAKMLKMTRAVYPEAAKTSGTEGTVIVQAVVLMDGSVGNPVAFAGADPELAKAAVDAVRQWKYVPAMLNGKPVEVATTVEIDFRLTRE